MSPPTGSTEPPSALEKSLHNGFAVTAEFGPPVDPDPENIRAAATALRGLVDAVNVTDNQAATVKVSALAASALLLREGVEPIMQITGRDRNSLAAQSDLLGAWTLGVRTVMALSGDPLKVGRYESLATHVRDLDSLGVIRLVTLLNAGELLGGERLTTRTSFRIVAAANPLADSVQRLKSKLAAGAHLFQTNIVYDVGRFADWLEPVVAAGITDRAPLLVGVTPPRSTTMLRHMHDRIPGVEVDDATFARMRDRTGEAAKAEGIAIAAEIVRGVRGIPGVAGVHLMAPGWETEAVPAIVEAASEVLGDRAPR
ncbi:MAG: methylenetetrahydrofolate reductase [Pseudonocardia sp.]|nr:methylenetetrahydrofolate reductase [Pseudonocardia sp.]